jgi:ribosomal protein L17
MTEEMQQKGAEGEARDNSKDHNFAQLRKSKEEAERRFQQQEMLNQQLASELNQLKAMVTPRAQDELDPYAAYGIERGGLVEADKFAEAIKRERELSKKLARKEAEAVAEAMITKREKSAFGERLRNRYQDYDQVVNPENVELLAQRDPESAEVFEEIADDFKRREFAYKRIKKILNEDNKKKVSAQDLVDRNKNSAYHYSEGGAQAVPNPNDLRAFVNDPQAKAKYYEQLKANQKRGLR